MMYETLKQLYSRNTLSQLSGTPKKFYKLNLTLLTFELLKGIKSNYIYFITQCNSILFNPKGFTDENEYSNFNKYYINEINDFIPRDKNQDNFINDIIQLSREIFEELSHNKKVLLRVSELQHTFNVVKYFRKIFKDVDNNNLKPHVWIDLDLTRGITPTYPELLTYGDLINLWGIYLDKIKQLDDYMDSYTQQYKQINYDLQTLSKHLNISAITFVESYLYHIFYDVKESNYLVRNDSIKRFLTNIKVEDEQIIKQLIIPEFCYNNTEKTEEINRLFKIYEDLNKKRNRFIHVSAFEQNGKSHLLPLLDIDHQEIIRTLEVCTDLVIAIESILPSDFKLLFWWEIITHPDYKNEKKGNYILREGI